jgi:hypothetical protein
MKLGIIIVSVALLAGVSVPAVANEHTGAGHTGAEQTGAEQTVAGAHRVCDVRSWDITWGFKESFRSYLSGTMARGGWETAGNISYTTPTFFLVGSSGFVNPEGDRGEIVGSGRIEFTGHDDFLNQRISAPRLVIEAPNRAALFVDVSGDTQEGVSVEEASVRFAEVTIRRYSVDPGAGVWAVLGAPVVLTEEGGAAFGMYPAGEMLDPMDIVIRVSPGCLERDNLVALWLVGGGGVFALGVISSLVWRRVRERK